ncbi:U4/U6.U5 tri-snRNP-associated protein 1 [Fasciola hepatica]|uniref:U4/U6.U5 tri-snRNP-associated protein 1 n=1 Tax=Fasciola hepatica TaxID=6192 RepID=A0A4E0R8J8_FASHE|nr:U4/U6.U5 tri-snRNP-associated protein 1 [Fasciola hepatica]
MPEKSSHSSDQKRRSRRTREHARSPFEEDDHRLEKKRSRRHMDVDSSLDSNGKFIVLIVVNLQSRYLRVDQKCHCQLKKPSKHVHFSQICVTSALRAKLGLAPLETEEARPYEDRIVDNQSENYVHAPAKDLKKARETDAIRERLSVQKEKRNLYEKYADSRLYEPEEKNVPVMSWVEKLREKERIKKQAQEQAKLLTEMDEQFEVSELYESTDRAQQDNTYRPEDLTGLKVEHKVDRFSEGKSVILTLKDKAILDEDDSDVLINVNLADDEKAEINRENLRKTAGLAGIADQEDEDVLLGLRQKAILSKYDSEIKGVRKDEFTLGETGVYNPEAERMLRQLQEELRAGKQSLPDTELRVASEYYTEDELKAKFKKRKKVKPRARTILTADDLVPDDELQPSVSATDLGSRAARENPNVSDVQSRTVDPLSAITDPTLGQPDSTQGMDVLEDLSHDNIGEDDLRGDIEKTIQRVIQSKSTVYLKPEEIAAQLLSRKTDPDELSESSRTSRTNLAESSSGVVFDSTAEFYKSIGAGFQESVRQIARQNALKREVYEEDDSDRTAFFPPPPAYSTGRLKSEPVLSSESDEEMIVDDKDQMDAANRWQTVADEDTSGRRRHHRRPFAAEMARPSTSDTSDEPNLTGVLDDEPRLDSGLCSALRLAEKKGYIEKGKEKRVGTGTMVNLMAKHFIQEDIRYDDIDAKFSKRDRYAGPLSEFKDLKNFKPDVKLEYVDELGCPLNAKEAFRQLSHKFHGKGSGKNKTEKRTKKIKEEFLLKASTSSDTPLGTAEKLNKKLESISLPYVILSGKNAAVKNLTK